MTLHPQLARQLKRAFALDAVGDADGFVAQLAQGQVAPQAGGIDPKVLATLFTRISDSFEAYERDITLRTRSLEISSQELGEANERLTKAYDQQRRAIDSLHAAAARLTKGHALTIEGDEKNVEALAQLMTELALEREQTAKRLRASEERLNLALVASGTALWDRDVVSGDLYISEQWGAILGRKVPNPMPVELLNYLVHPDDHDTMRRAFTRHLRGETDMLQVLLRHMHGSGRWIWCKVSGRVVERDASGRATRAIGTLQDVTPQVEAEHALREARDAAEQASRAKSQFLATMSHEIRTPMNGVIGVVDLLAETGLTADQAKFVKILHTSGEALLSIINDVLDFSRIEAGRLELNDDDVDVNALASGVADLFRAQASRKAITIGFRADNALPVVRCDPLRLRQVLLNLVGNAVKFTDAGDVEVSATRIAETDEQVEVRIAVRDTGPGISPEVQKMLFAPFVQADGTTTRRHGGSGLGLAISKRLSEMMGGRMELDSAPGEGSTFSVVLTLVKSARQLDTPVDGAGAVLASVPAGLRVLLVEDNPLNQTIARSLLANLDIAVEVASNGREGVERARSGRFDVVLMDCLMPVMDGFDATRAIRAEERASGRRRVPIIALTANAFQEDVQRCLDAGMDSHLSKPIRRNQLIAALAKWCTNVIPA